VETDANLDAPLGERVDQRLPAANTTGRPVERGDESIASCVHLTSAEPGELIPDQLVVDVQDPPPSAVTHTSRGRGRFDDLVEHHGGEHTIRLNAWPFAGEKLADSFQEPVGDRRSRRGRTLDDDEICTCDVIRQVLAVVHRNDGIVLVVDHEGRYL